MLGTCGSQWRSGAEHVALARRAQKSCCESRAGDLLLSVTTREHAIATHSSRQPANPDRAAFNLFCILPIVCSPLALTSFSRNYFLYLESEVWGGHNEFRYFLYAKRELCKKYSYDQSDIRKAYST